jgi:plasmid stabilization system protein ParE
VDQGRRLVSWTAAARDCLDEIVGYVAAESPVAAGRLLEVILDAAESLSDLATRGRQVPELGVDSIREIFVYRYRLMYQVASGEVRILAVLHGAMDFERWLKVDGT